jgi:hypothetical protein
MKRSYMYSKEVEETLQYTPREFKGLYKLSWN